ncbi:MAG: hypothetical protein ACXWQQ_12620 [Pseudobdellovibrio sp.]
MKYLGILVLIYVGMFSRFTSSEFWPITISKTWFNFPNYEHSMVQKPLLTIGLSLIHLLPLNDTVHLVFVKVLFSAIGAFGVLYLVNYILLVAGKESEKEKVIYFNLITLAAVFISPTFFSNFFSVRSDQVAFSLFAIFLYMTENKKMKTGLVSLLLIPLFGIKEIIFIPVGLAYFYFTFRDRFSKKFKLYSFLAGLGILFWAVALNIPYAYYFYSAYDDVNYWYRFTILNSQLESIFAAAALAVMIYAFKSNSTKLIKVSLISLYFILIYMVIPQAFAFFVGSIILFIYLPIFTLLASVEKKQVKTLGLISLTAVSILGYRLYNDQYRLYSVFPQYRFIHAASNLIQSNHFQYLDGVGILPKQNFYHCFVSPSDLAANNGCLNTPHNPDVIIITNRLSFLGDAIFKKVEPQYTQIYPNLWVLNEKMNDELRSLINLNNSTLPLPIVIFN